LLTIGIVGSYLVARYFLTPPSFGQYGWYRADALVEARGARQLSYAGRKACDECHSEETQKLAKFEHKTVSCEACHGVGQAHADDPGVAITKPTDGLCIRCHEADPARPTWLRQIQPKSHYTGRHCVECHVPHQPNEVP
jgi:excinuclease UvrABC ATPase subunit